MSKRISSEFNFAPQLKKHVGEMDVEYVCARQSIYDKTIDLLFKAAQNKPKVSSVRKSLNGTSCISACTDTRDNLKQMIMNSKCQLETKLLHDRHVEVNLTPFDKCSFCEKLGCFTSLLQCSKCKDLFCNNCSFPQSTNNDGILCLSCFN